MSAYPFGGATVAGTSSGGGISGSGQPQPYAYPTAGPPAGAAVMPATFSSHPFQYIQECLDPGSPNFRFRVSPGDE